MNLLPGWFPAGAFAAESGGWDLSTASYDSVSLDVSVQDNSAFGITFKPDGTKMYMVGYDGDSVYQYTLATPWDLAAASFDSVVLSVAARDDFPIAVQFKPDGTKMYIIGLLSGIIYQYTLATAWDLSTASYDSVSFSTDPQSNQHQGLTFNPDGTKMYMVGTTNDAVYQYTLSTAWELSTASYDSVSFSVGPQDTDPAGISFNPDGTKMYITGLTNDNVYQYTLATPWDLSTASYDSVSFNVGSQGPSPTGMSFKPDGTKMYIANNKTIYQYSL